MLGRLRNSASVLPRRTIFKVVIGFIASILVLKALYETAIMESPMRTELLASNIQLRIQEARSRTDINGSAFVFLALGVQTNQLNCPAAIESLVRFGGWGGHVFMLTDKESCFDRDRILRDSEIDANKLHIIKVHDNFGGGGVDMEHGFRKNRQLSMAVKPAIFEYLPDWVHTIAYADCDILFGLEGCPAQFLVGGPSWDESKIKFSRLYFEPDGEFKGGIHCGTFVAHRQHSKLVMQMWRDILLTLRYEGDNDAYHALYLALQAEIDIRRQKKAGAVGAAQPGDSAAAAAGTATAAVAQNAQNKSGNIRIASSNPASPHYLHQELFQNPVDDAEFFKKYLLPNGKNIFTPGEIFDSPKQESWVSAADLDSHRIEKFVHPPSVLQSARPHCMEHIAKARCSRFGRDAMQVLVDKYNLRTYLKYSSAKKRPVHHNTPTKVLPSGSSNSGDVAAFLASVAVINAGAGGGKQQQHNEIVFADSHSDQNDDRYQYCANPLVQPLLYGWFPFSWVPMCPKLEAIL